MSVASRRLIPRVSAGCYGPKCQKIPKQHHFVRGFRKSPQRATDGVYKELTEMRIRTPWIEALRKKREEERDLSRISETPAALPDRDLRPKKMSDSFTRINVAYHAVPHAAKTSEVLPLAQDPWLLDSYLNASGHIRLGTLFMDLDALSGIVAYKHTGESVTTVTAAVDRITINHPLEEICDLELSGHVTYATGRSSMEISLQVAKAPAENQAVQKEDVLLTCAFTMVSLDPSTKRPVAINPLQVETPEERRLFELGERNSNAKRAMAKTALLKQTPNDEESDLIHAMWLKQEAYDDPKQRISKPENVIYMDKTILYSSQIMQPQYRNRHNFMIFGGFLLKQTFELAFCCAASFSHTRPTFLALDPSTFENPVPVGSVLYLTATVAYTDPPPVSEHDELDDSTSRTTKVQVRIDSRVRNVEHGETKPTGQFNYTFLVEKDIKVMPRQYREFMIWVDARRRAERVSATLGSTGGEICASTEGDGRNERVTE